MRRSAVFRVGDGNPYDTGMMAEGRLSGPRVHFDDKKWGKEFDPEEAVKAGFNADAWKKLTPAQQREIAGEYMDLRPPYAPAPTLDEITKTLDWIATEDSHVESVSNDPVYQFVYLVAGHLGENIDRMLKYDVNKRRGAISNFDVPGDDIKRELQTSWQNVIDSMTAVRRKMETQSAFDYLKIYVDLVATGTAVPRTAAVEKEQQIDPTDISADLIDAYNLLPEGDDNDDPSVASVGGLLNYMDIKGQEGVLPGRYISARATGDEVINLKGVIENPDVHLVPYLIANSFEGYTIQFADTPDSLEYAEYKGEMDRLKGIMSQLTLTAIRKRHASTLDWLERSEVLKMADMNEEMFMGLNKATTMVIRRIPGLRGLDGLRDPSPEGILINTNNREFFSKFAELTGKIIEQTRFFSKGRGSYDRNHMRLSMLIDRMVKSMQSYTYSDGEIISGYYVRSGPERVAYY
jgi:hypothetical protein